MYLREFFELITERSHVLWSVPVAWSVVLKILTLIAELLRAEGAQAEPHTLEYLVTHWSVGRTVCGVQTNTHWNNCLPAVP